ncbi:hypothetical protein RUM44_001750 [Polyplax serrata]|uniref:Uncharacterized protein n=1 Tax=Polyplax serrata TaxID=468196 RepID=A0ABR1AKX5_POLSC
MSERWLPFIFLILTENYLLFITKDLTFTEALVISHKDKRLEVKIPTKRLPDRENHQRRTSDPVVEKFQQLPLETAETFNGDDAGVRERNQRANVSVKSSGRTILPFGFEAVALLMAKALLIAFISIVISATVGFKSDGAHFHGYSEPSDYYNAIYDHSHQESFDYPNHDYTQHVAYYQHHQHPEDQNLFNVQVQNLGANPVAAYPSFGRDVND